MIVYLQQIVNQLLDVFAYVAKVTTKRESGCSYRTIKCKSN